ncbi:hypothetical protein [Vibrio algivorus]|uniref:Uncharacterized protein n=1 Tax=Vibrio algivorus TaxID=1667024 RepID=A0A557PFM7_9VIBR|nr:hypothetical protein [Vibrio algivorus]TVO39436.1 hypothetical protein FOF44_02290 [Vibrio algivorus]
MKLIKLIPLIAAMPLLAQANVVLTSDGSALLINDKVALLAKTMYDGNGNEITSIKIIESDDKEAKVFLTVDDKRGVFEIRATGYSEADLGSGTDIYNASCQLVGVSRVSFYPIDYIADGYINIGEQSHYEVSQLGESVSGFNIMGLSLDYDPSTGEPIQGQDCSQGTPMTGRALEYSQALTDSVNTFFDQLIFPLSIK